MDANEALERRIDELCVENENLRKELEAEHALAETLGHFHEYAQAENDKLRQAFNETLVRLVAANEVTVSDYMDDEYCDLLRELGIEVDG